MSPKRLWSRRELLMAAGGGIPGLALANQLYIAVQAQGHGRKGTHSLLLALATLSGIDWTRR